MVRLSTGLVLIPLLLSACGKGEPPAAPSPSVRTTTDGPLPPYRLEAPDTRFELPGRLDEISGLTVLDDTHLGAVQDEKGRLYVIDVETGEVQREHVFGKGGDYEGVERVGERVFVLRSDGRLFVIDEWRSERAEAQTLDTGLHGSCDAEGLGYEASGAGAGRLLIACKEHPGRGFRGARAIYAFDLATNRLDPTPTFTIHADSLARRDGEHAIDEAVRAFVRPITDINAFKPSALAVHPLTGEVYVVSSVRKLLVALDSDGEVTAAWPLSDDLLRQPEGLAFLPDGTLFIASEAAGGTAVLLRFAYQPSP